MGIFKSIGKKMTHGMELSARRQVRQQLLHMSDRQLADAGFSRVKLMEGVSAWPWSVESENDTAAKVEPAPVVTNIGEKVRKAREVKRAINELNSYSDRDLAELGVSRQSIEEAVRFGRPSIEGVAQEQSRVA